MSFKLPLSLTEEWTSLNSYGWIQSSSALWISSVSQGSNDTLSSQSEHM